MNIVFFIIGIQCAYAYMYPVDLNTINQSWQHYNGLFNIKNLVDNGTDNSSLIIKIKQGSNWNIISSIYFKNIRSNNVLKPTFQYNVPIYQRVDSGSSIRLNISLKTPPEYQVRLKANVVIRLRESGSLVIFTYAKKNIENVTDCSTSDPVYYYHTESSNIWIQQRYCSGSYDKEIDIMGILLLVCQDSSFQMFSCRSEVESFYYDFKFYTSDSSLGGIVEFNTSVRITNNCQNITFPIATSKFLMFHHFFGQPSIQQKSYLCQIAKGQFVFNYNFKIIYQSSTNKLQCTLERAIAYMERGRFTAIDLDNIIFPISIKEKTIRSSFSVWMDATYGDVVAEVCYMIMLRNDYNLTTRTFNNLTDAGVEVNVCYWSNVHQNMNPIQRCNIQNSDYAHYFYTTSRRHFFVKQTQIDRRKKVFFKRQSLNLSKFVEKVGLTQHQIVTVRRGWRVFCGKVVFGFIDQDFEIMQNPIPQTPSILPSPKNVTIINNTILKQIAISETANSAVGGAVSLPNIGMILRLAQILNTLDDLSYFTYHNTTYDVAFTYFCNLSWGWVNSKWIPPETVHNLIGINLSSGSLPGLIPFREAELRFQVNGERMAFLDNCKGFLFYTVPSSLLLFLILWKIHSRFKSYKAAAVLTSFSSWAYLFVSMICDNGQYLAFRGFQSLRSLQPSNQFAVLSEVLAFISLFFAAFCSFGLLAATHSFASRFFKPPTLLRLIPSYKFFCIWTSARFFAGFVHASIDQPLLRISILLSLQLTVTITTLLSSPQTRFKTPHTLLVFAQLARLSLYTLIFLEVVFPSIAGSLDSEGCISGISNLLIWVMFFANILQIVMTVGIGVVVTPRDAEFGKERKEKKGCGRKKKEGEEEKEEDVKKVGFGDRREQIRVKTLPRQLVGRTHVIPIDSEAVNTTQEQIKSRLKTNKVNMQTTDFEQYIVKKYKHQKSVKHIKANKRRKEEVEREKLKMSRYLNQVSTPK